MGPGGPKQWGLHPVPSVLDLPGRPTAACDAQTFGDDLSPYLLTPVGSTPSRPYRGAPLRAGNLKVVPTFRGAFVAAARPLPLASQPSQPPKPSQHLMGGVRSSPPQGGRRGGSLPSRPWWPPVSPRGFSVSLAERQLYWGLGRGRPLLGVDRTAGDRRGGRGEAFDRTLIPRRLALRGTAPGSALPPP